MKILCLLIGVVHFFNFGYSQIGIGTTSPDQSAVVDVYANDAGMLLPRMTTSERNTISDPVHGLMIFNTDKSCLEINYGTSTDINWNCVGTFSTSAVITDCGTNGFEGNYINGTALTASHTFSLTVTNNSFSTANISFSNSDLILSGIGGISVASVNPPSATLISGSSQLVEYTLTGTPSSGGTLIGVWTKLGLSCIQQVNVIHGNAMFNLPDAITVISINDGSPIVDIQGIIDNGSNQFTVNLPYTGGVGTYDAFTGNYVLNNTGTGEGGDINRFRLSYPGGTFSSSGSIAATLEVDGDGSFNARKQLFGAVEAIVDLDVQVNGNNIGNISVEVAGGILDRNYTDPNHRFIYLPVVAADGRTWLNNNLGANYANTNHPQFNVTMQATAHNDYHAYGSLYQWGVLVTGMNL